MNYKTTECRYPGTCTKAHCPFYHTEAEKRTPPSSHFKLYPKNRGQVDSQAKVYQSVFLEVMYKEPRKSQNIINVSHFENVVH